jgi:copper chaperone NosL
MKTRTKSRLLLALAALVMLPVFVSPLWSIRLVAPQYPEGLGMYIYVNDVQGHDRHDLQNINILNHYIGMQEIEPEAIPELEIMPVILAALIVSGLAVALIGNPWLMAGWLGVFLVTGAAGMVDFYMWNIDYGHNLSPDAPIRIPDMTYSPPIIGSTQLLNIRATSYPHFGTLFLTVSALLAGLAVFLGFRARKQGKGAGAPDGPGGITDGGGSGEGAEIDPRQQHEGKGGKRPVLWPTTVLAALALLAAGCGGDAAPAAGSAGADAGDRIVYGESEDPFCGDVVETVRWGGELRTRDGQRFRFRSVECLAAYILDGELDPDEVAEVKVVDFPHGWKLIDVKEATFLHTPNLSSPTRLNLLAIAEEKMVVNLQAAYDGDLLRWEEVLELVAREWEMGASASAGPQPNDPDSRS